MSAQPLAPVTSIKVKLGMLVAASVSVAAVVAAVGDGAGVPLLLVIPVTVALAIGVTQLLASGMTSPLRQMTQATREMARGDYSGRMTTSSRDEIGELATAFNQMASDLATVDRERRDLVATVSHELRTPLAALTARLENLADGVEPVEPTTLEQVLGQARALGGLVTDLLDLSRLDAGHATLRLEPLPVGAFLAEVAAGVDVPGRQVRYAVSADPADLTVVADRRRLLQLATNLVVNATRHSPVGGTVSLTATASVGGHWRLEVSDAGPGVATADRERVFERFGTLAGNDGGGTGLGLAIARWVATLHGGTIRFVDPRPGEGGARVRVDLPCEPQGRQTSSPAGRPNLGGTMTAMSHPAAPASPTHDVVAPAAVQGLLGEVFGDFWRDQGVSPRRGLLIASVAVGVLGGLILPWRTPGIGWFLVIAAAGAVVVTAARPRDRFSIACAALAGALGSVMVLRDAEWIGALCLLAGGVVMCAGLTRARTVPAFILSAIAWPLAGIRGLPWLGRTVEGVGGQARSVAVVRTTLLSLLGLCVFGVLFASADPVFASWIRTVLPDVSFTRSVYRGFVMVFVGGAVLGAVYVAINPPRLSRGAGPSRPVQSRFEWLAPVLLVDLVFVVFLVAQAAAVFGGHDYIRRATGLTYAEYVHQGFAQLTVATSLTLLVVWAAARKSPRETPADRLWVRAALGLLGVLTLVVVASALYRMWVYQEAYGFTVLRLLVSVFEGWLGLVVLAVLAAGVALRGSWLPRFALLSGAGALLGLALVNPDAWIARVNIERFEGTAQMDWWYVGSLSADAVPAVLETTADLDELFCLPGSEEGDWLTWNLGSARAQTALDDAGISEDSAGDLTSCVSGD